MKRAKKFAVATSFLFLFGCITRSLGELAYPNTPPIIEEADTVKLPCPVAPLLPTIEEEDVFLSVLWQKAQQDKELDQALKGYVLLTLKKEQRMKSYIQSLLNLVDCKKE